MRYSLRVNHVGMSQAFSLTYTMHLGEYTVLATTLMEEGGLLFLQLPFSIDAWVERNDANTPLYSIEKERGEYLMCVGTWRAVVTPPGWHKDISVDERSPHMSTVRRHSPLFLLFVLVTCFTGWRVDSLVSARPVAIENHYQSVFNFYAVLTEKGGTATYHGGDMTLAFHIDVIAQQDEHSCNHVPTACFRLKMVALGMYSRALSYIIDKSERHILNQI